jgi:hypothetical protein
MLKERIATDKATPEPHHTEVSGTAAHLFC